MNYKVNILGNSYDLPARTLAVDEQIEAVGSLDAEYKAKRMTRREVVERMHAFVEGFAPGAFPSLEEADTNELTAACTDIISAYSAPARKTHNDAQMVELREVMNRPELQKLLTMLNAMQNTCVAKKP